MRISPLSIWLPLVAVVIAWLPDGQVQAAGESYSLGYDLIRQAEKVLKEAAASSPNRHSKPDTVQRDVYDITFLLEQAVRAAEKANDTAMKDYAHEALRLLQRAVAQGNFDPAQVEPVMRLIRQLLPNVSA
jgi:hypothetical protein